MGTLLLVVGVFAGAVAGCGTGVTKRLLVTGRATASHSPSASEGEDAPPPAPLVCLPPPSAKGLVFGIIRSSLPHGAPETTERGELTVDGSCTRNVECARVTPETMRDIALLVRAASGGQPKGAFNSPHYGGRYVTAQWIGGKCELGDSSIHPLEGEAARRFYAAFDAIINTVVGARDGGSKP